jgi:hypothetical protein
MVFLQKLGVVQLVNKVSDFYGTQKFFALSARPCPDPLEFSPQSFFLTSVLKIPWIFRVIIYPLAFRYFAQISHPPSV